ncbi:hypothetical protein [Rhodococcus globerulus]|uniref:hypothetical protein n=1 Tax=Rhodococcus globerulus TaxID=33008 RepID=UPI003018DCEC
MLREHLLDLVGIRRPKFTPTIGSLIEEGHLLSNIVAKEAHSACADREPCRPDTEILNGTFGFGEGLG